MATLSLGYADLIRESGSRHPVSGILSRLTENGAEWSALVTASGKLIESHTADDRGEVDAETLARAVEGMTNRMDKARIQQADDGNTVMGFPIGAEGRSTALLVMSCAEPVHPDLHRFGVSAAMLLRLLLRDTRRLQTASRMVRDSVTRLMFSGRLSSAVELAAEMGLATPPNRPHVVCIRGVGSWDRDDLIDILEAAMPRDANQLLAYNDDDECWLLLNEAQFDAMRHEVVALVDQHPNFQALLTEQVPASKLSHRWQPWIKDIRAADPGTVVDRSGYRGSTPSDWVHKLQREASEQVLETIVEYLRQRGRWETAADALGIHRNTLRYRVGTAETLLDLDFTDPTTSSRLWLALRNEGLTD